MLENYFEMFTFRIFSQTFIELYRIKNIQKIKTVSYNKISNFLGFDPLKYKCPQ